MLIELESFLPSEIAWNCFSALGQLVKYFDNLTWKNEGQIDKRLNVRKGFENVIMFEEIN